MQTLSVNKPLAFTRAPKHSNTKQINDYLIDLNCMIGEGSFSKVYKSTNLKTSNPLFMQTRQWRSRSWRWLPFAQTLSSSYCRQKSIF